MKTEATMETEMNTVSEQVGRFSKELCQTHDIRAVAAIWFAEAGLLARCMRQSGVIPVEQIGELFALLMETVLTDGEKPRIVYGAPSERAS